MHDEVCCVGLRWTIDSYNVCMFTFFDDVIFMQADSSSLCMREI